MLSPHSRVYGLLTGAAYDVAPGPLGGGAAGVVHATLCGQHAVKFLAASMTELQLARVCEWVRLVKSAAVVHLLPGGDRLCLPKEPVSAVPGGEAIGLVLPLAPGVDLDRFLADRRAAPAAEPLLVRVAFGVAALVSVVHALGVPELVLRDLKPSNFRVDPLTGCVFAVDLEDVSMRPVRLPTGAVADAEGEHTTSGFVSPEELYAAATGAPYRASHADDLFSLGVTLYAVLFCWHPCEPEPAVGGEVELDQAVYDGAFVRYPVRPASPPPAATMRSDVPPDVDALFLRCFFSVAPDARPQAVEWCEALARWWSALNPPVGSVPSRWRVAWRKTRRALRRANELFAAHVQAVCLAMVLVGAGVVGLWAMREAGATKELPKIDAPLAAPPSGPPSSQLPNDELLEVDVLGNPFLEAGRDKFEIPRAVEGQRQKNRDAPRSP